MSNRYRVLLPLMVHTSDASYTQDDVFEHTFTEDEETENVRSGLLEIVPRTYKVIGGSEVFETPPGEEFERALPLGIEALLVEGGHIERVEKPAKRKDK
jgi:hypothetical protein